MNPRIFGALIVGSGLVAIAVIGTRFNILGDNQPAATNAQMNVVASAEPLRQYIPTKDSNNDGVPDWQELLNNTEPLQINESAADYQAPDTLTDQFAIEFFEGYVRNKGFGAFAEEPDQLIAQASDNLVAQAQDTLYDTGSINIIPTSPNLVRTHANAVAQIILDYPLPVGTENELLIIERAIVQDDESVLAELDPIIAAYTGMIEDMLSTPVPSNMVKEHLDLLNAYQGIRNTILGMRNSFADPLMGLLRVQRYQDDANGLAIAITNLFEAAYENDASFVAGDAVFSIVMFSEQ